jgi:hypothetical protein
MPTFQDWLHTHDERWSFILPYVLGAVLISIFLGMFWVAVLMLAHFGLEIVRFRALGVPTPGLHGLWHTKLDFGLVLVALAIAVYAQALFAVLGAGYAARGAQVAARFGVVQRTLRVALLTFDEVLLFARAVWRATRRAPAGAAAAPPPRPACPVEAQAHDAAQAQARERALGINPWRYANTGDWVSLALAPACVLAILAAPAVTGHDAQAIVEILLHELRPW